jgi:hypothetical protein
MSNVPTCPKCGSTDRFFTPYQCDRNPHPWHNIARLERAEKAKSERDDAKDAQRYRWILEQAAITDHIFWYLQSRERHVSNAIDEAIKAE